MPQPDDWVTISGGNPDDWVDITPKKYENKPSYYDQYLDPIVSTLTRAPDIVTKPIKRFEDWITTPSLTSTDTTKSIPMGKDSFISPQERDIAGAQLKGFIGGSAVGLGNQLSPANVAQQAFPESKLINYGVTGLQGLSGVKNLAQGNYLDAGQDLGWAVINHLLGPNANGRGGDNRPPLNMSVEDMGPVPSGPSPQFRRQLEGRVEPVNTPPPSQPGPPPGGVGHRIIRDDWTPVMMEHYKQMGYVPGGIDPISGNAYMEFKGTQQQAPSQEQPSNPFDQVPVEEDSTGETVKLNKPSNTAIENLKAEGFKLVEIDRSGIATFKRLFTDESGEVDFGALKAGLRRMLGREPTEEEVQRKAFEENSHISVEPGVQTGRVAPFEDRKLQDSFPSNELLQYLNSSGLTPELRTEIENILKRRGVPPNPENAPPVNGPLYKGWDWNEPQEPLVQEPQVHEIPLKMAYNMPEEIRPIGDTPVGQLIQNVQPTGDPQLDTQINRMKEIVSSPRMSNDLWEELRTLGYTVSRNPNMPPDFRRNWSQSSSAPQGPQLGPRVVPPPVQFKEPEIDPNINVTNPIDQLRGQNQLQNISQAQPGQIDLGPQPTQESFGLRNVPDPVEPMFQRAFKSDPNRMDLGPRYYGQGRPSIAGDLVQARDSQNERARALGIDPKGMSDDELVNAIRRARGLTDEEPMFAKVKGGGLQISTDNRRAATNITKDYSSPLEGIMNREGMQNGLDAAELMGLSGKVRLRITNKTATNPATMEIHDNGLGMDEATLADKLTTLFATGKENQAGATGGKGIGSASYILGGEHFSIDTVAVDSNDMVDEEGNIIRKADGKKYRIEAGGTPEQFHSPQGSDWSKTPVPANTPTGTSIKVILKNNQELHYTRTMADNIIAHSRDRQSKVIYDQYGYMTSGTPISEIQPNDPGFNAEHTFKSSKGDKIVADFTFKNNEIKVQVPPFNPNEERSYFKVHMLNNGMYQFSEEKSIGSKVKDFPSDVIVNIQPQVDEMHNDYPFTNTREHLKNDIKEVIDKIVKNKLSGPAVERKKNRTQELYDSMPLVSTPGLKRKSVIFDPGNRLTPDEVKNIQKNPIVKSLLLHYDNLIDGIVQTTGRLEWADRLEGVGIVFDPTINGVMIPNPTTGKATILINPFARMEGGLNPKDNAWDSTITALHETAHIGKETGRPIVFSPGELNDPRIGKFLQDYMNELVNHGDVGYEQTGHGMGFTHRLGEVFSSFGVENTYEQANQLEQILSDNTGGYRPEIQRIFQLYQERNGRDATTEDLLSPTGVKQANRRSGGTGNIPGNSQTTRDGTPVKQSKLREAYNLSRGITTTMDLSAPLRQGLPLIGTRAWWTSWNQQMRALGSEEAYNKTIADIKVRPMFRRYRDSRTGKEIKSFAEQAGLALTDVSTNLNQREESIASSWTESGKMFGEDNAVQRGYKATIGRGARASNRAYTAYLNQLRADTFETLIKSAKASFDSSSAAGTLTKTGDKDPLTDMTYAREIASVVNTLTGRGSLTLVGPSMEGGKLHLKEHSAEAAAGLLTNTMFAPRNTAAKMQMMNPMTYMMASPFVRKQYLKGLLGVAGAWLTVSGLASLAGADVTLDLRSADFGKVKIGNFRLDPGGGFQQFLVDYARNATGHTLSSASGKNFELGQGYRAPTRKDINEGFWVNKLHPMIKFAYDIFDASTHQPFGVMDRTLQQVVPLVVQDLWDIVKENPELLSFSPAIIAGMGTQIYNKGQTEERFIPKEYDYNFTGGELPGSSLFQ